MCDSIPRRMAGWAIKTLDSDRSRWRIGLILNRLMLALFFSSTFYAQILNAVPNPEQWNAVTGNILVSTNWSPHTVPIGGYNTPVAIIDNGGTAVMSAGYYYSPSITIGNVSSGSMLMTGGTMLFDYGLGLVVVLGNKTGSTGTLTVSGGIFETNEFYPGQSYPPLEIGVSGKGLLTINGGFVQAANTYLGYATGGVGTINITSGELLANWIVLGNVANSTGIINVTGPTSTISAGSIIFSNGGNATLNISNGGNVTGAFYTPTYGTAILGGAIGSAGSLSIDGAGSVLNATGIAYIQNGGVNITRGGVVNTDTIFVSPRQGGDAIINVSGSGSQLNLFFNKGYGYLGASPGGTSGVFVADGGAITGVQVAQISGNLAVDGLGSVVNISQELDLNANNINDGFVNITNGGVINVGDVTAGIGGLNINSNGRVVIRAGSISGGVNVNSNGYISAYAGSISGGINLNGGKLGLYGTLHADNLSWNSGAISMNLSGVDNASNLLALSGSLIKGSGSLFNIDFRGTGLAGQTYTVMTFVTGESGFGVNDFSYGDLAPGLMGSFNLDANDLTFTTTVIPEASAFPALAGLGVLGLAVLHRRSTVSATHSRH